MSDSSKRRIPVESATQGDDESILQPLVFDVDLPDNIDELISVPEVEEEAVSEASDPEAAAAAFLKDIMQSDPEPFPIPLGPTRLVTSEAVTEGHPDKLADQISDAVLDAVLREEAKLDEQSPDFPAGLPLARCACETLVTTGTVVVAGELRTRAYVDVDQVARDVIRRVGYDRAKYGFDADTCGIISMLHKQSPDIAQGVDDAIEERGRGKTDPLDSLGAGDQGIMYGYATDETPTYMPMPIYVAQRLARRLADVRKDGTVPYLRPDGKTQVTVRYDGDTPVAIDTILVSTQHAPEVSQETVREDVIRHVISPVMGSVHLPWGDARILVNPTGRFVIGGPMGDTGLTGRKLVVDSYGGVGRMGGGAQCGKDGTKVDRSAFYAARWVARTVVAAGLAHRCEVQLSYAIGVARPVSISVDTQGTGQVGSVSDERIAEAVGKVFDLRPAAIIRDLGLLEPIYERTSCYGQVGRTDVDLPWESDAKVGELRKALGL